MTIERTAKRSVNYKMCKRCKGKYCCQEHSGIYSPSDFSEELTISFIKQLLEEKKACISSCVFSDEPQKIYLYLCVPEIGKGPIDLFSLPAACSFWNPETGCKFKRVNQRPWSCATLVPDTDGCIRYYSPEDVVKDWMPHQKKLEKVVVQLTGKSSKDVLKQNAASSYPALKDISKQYQTLPKKYYGCAVYLRSLGYQL